MFVLIGTIIVFGSIIAGYTMHGGQLAILMQVTEFIIIGGAAIGALLIANPLSVTRAVGRGIVSTFKPTSIDRGAYLQLLQVMYDLFQLARRDGNVALEAHFENPESSAIFAKAPAVTSNHHAIEFLCDTLRTVVSANIPPHDLEDLMDKDLETAHASEYAPVSALATMADAFPGLGIVAAVLGVVITMSKIDQPPAVIGASVGAALVGTFLGVLLSYGIVGPLAKNMEHQMNAQGRYLSCIKAGILAFSKGVPPAVVVEYARRAIAPEERPTFTEAEAAIKGQKAQG